MRFDIHEKKANFHRNERTDLYFDLFLLFCSAPTTSWTKQQRRQTHTNLCLRKITLVGVKYSEVNHVPNTVPTEGSGETTIDAHHTVAVGFDDLPRFGKGRLLLQTRKRRIETKCEKREHCRSAAQNQNASV